MGRWLLIAVSLAQSAACVATLHSRRPDAAAVAPASTPSVETSPDSPDRPGLARLRGLPRVAGVSSTPAKGVPRWSDPTAPNDPAELEDWRFGMGEVLDDAAIRLQAWADQPRPTEPDLSKLTRQPVSGAKSSGYGWRDDPFRHTRRFHAGADFPSKLGTPVAAAGEGTVTFAGRVRGYGNMISVDHGGGIATLYAHLRRIEVSPGARIAAGQRIGQVGRTGRATGPHLHFEVRVDGRPVDPVLAMAAANNGSDSPESRSLAALAQRGEVQPAARPETSRRSRRKNSTRPAHRHSKRLQALW